MKTGWGKRASLYIPGYANNSVLQLIIISGVGYAIMGITWAVMIIVYGGSDNNFYNIFLPNFSLAPLSVFKSHWWTILTYGWFQYPNSFMELLSNMLWLYLFGSVVQMLIGKRHIIPLFAYCIVFAGISYILVQLLPLKVVAPSILGAKAGIVGFAVAAVTLSPNYRYYFTETFSVPIVLVAGVFILLAFLSTGFMLPMIAFLLGGGITGYVYVRALKNGYKPEEWMYNTIHKVEMLVTPKENTKRPRTSASKMSFKRRDNMPNASQKRVDEILDKINQKGYDSLTKEEKEILVKAAKGQ